MRTFLKIILGLVVLGVVAFALVMFLTSGQRDTAKSFVMLSSTGDYPAARELLHVELQKDFTIARFEEAFAGVKPYIDVSFGSVETGASGTKMEGSASTADGCTSKVAIEVLDGRIISFNITPLCRE